MGFNFWRNMTILVSSPKVQDFYSTHLPQCVGLDSATMYVPRSASRHGRKYSIKGPTLLGEELCFRHTTTLGSCRDMTALTAPRPHRTYSISGISDGWVVLSGPLGCRKRSLGKRTHWQVRACRPCVPGGPVPCCFFFENLKTGWRHLMLPCAAAGRQQLFEN